MFQSDLGLSLEQCFLTCARLNPSGSVNRHKGFGIGPDTHTKHNSKSHIELQSIISELCVNVLTFVGVVL